MQPAKLLAGGLGQRVGGWDRGRGKKKAGQGAVQQLTKKRCIQKREARRFQVPSRRVGSQVQPATHSTAAVPMPA